MTDYPASIPRTVGGSQRLERAADHHALCGDCGVQDAGRAVATIVGDAGSRFTILRGPLPVARAQGEIAVYVDRMSQQLAVPTGRIFVRFADGLEAQAHEATIARAGYRIAALIDYAPSAAWVEAKDGDVARALSGLDRLAAIPGVVSVEPQLLSSRAFR